MCFNRKVLAGLAAAAVGLFLIAPQLFGRALPLLILAACPLSMLVMMRSMRGRPGRADQEGAAGQSNGRPGAGAGPSEVDRLRAEIDELRSELTAGKGGAGLDRGSAGRATTTPAPPVREQR